ncbi:conserved hypothetical protein [metagenome]|uniref:GmrSD restriction endonucleases N-terminal domain-containing protein n=1 Tax=metagenome TaxID=256318 RepID=A0A2P2C7N9_9ZZZZ
MKGHQTTFVGLFDTPEDGRPAITAIEIPIIQRDFAQGRPDDEATAIRERFLDAIVRAATTDAEMALDFVYGDVKGGLLRPLDGQQRLTTLFLLHWYVASLAGALDPAAPWLRFTYATRPTARDFCLTIAAHPYPGGPVPPSEWIKDQPWYLYPWLQDPTISSMLVMLDEMHKRFDREQTDFGAVWARLVQRGARAIWFLFLPVADMDYGEDLYIKMNSRGKPLTPFEAFKADLEETLRPMLRGTPCLRDSHRHDLYEHLTVSMDGAWADLLWEYEKAGGSDFVIDDEFMRYLTFIIDVCEWRDGQPNRRWRDKEASREWPLEERARLSFADPRNQHSARNRVFFAHAFDTWEGVRPAAEFCRLFTAGGVGDGPLPLLVSSSPDLFGACIAKYGQEREFSLAETLMLFAVLLARLEPRPTEAELSRRLRSLRNLAESAFLDRKRMAEYIGTTERLIVRGTLDGAQGFNGEWTADEQLKWDRTDVHPRMAGSLHVLEDLTVIRGRLFAFELDAETIETRASAFAHIAHPPLRDALGAALLTKGDYSRDVGWNGQRRQLGSFAKDDSWRDLFTTGSRASVARTRVPLMALLDDVHARMTNGDGQAVAALDEIRREWLLEREGRKHFDWRYYLVRYPGARSSMGEGYFHNTGYDESRGGFSYGRLRMLHGGSYNAYFSDALLRAAWTEGNLGAIAREPRWWHRDDPGMSMNRSAVEIRCVDDGLELVLPVDDEATSALAIGAIQQFSGVNENRIRVDQGGPDGVPIDHEDRVQMCVRVARALHEAGL